MANKLDAVPFGGRGLTVAMKSTLLACRFQLVDGTPGRAAAQL